MTRDLYDTKRPDEWVRCPLCWGTGTPNGSSGIGELARKCGGCDGLGEVLKDPPKPKLERRSRRGAVDTEMILPIAGALGVLALVWYVWCPELGEGPKRGAMRLTSHTAAAAVVRWAQLRRDGRGMESGAFAEVLVQQQNVGKSPPRQTFRVLCRHVPTYTVEPIE